MSFRCPCCGKHHDDLPHVGIDKPDQWWDVPEEERAQRLVLTEDTCILDNEHYFIRGVIEIPVHDYPDSFGFGVWVSQKRENFLAYLQQPDSADIGPFFGWLCTRIAYYEDNTLFLKSRAFFREGNLRPLIELAPADHPLVVDQRNGITQAKAWEIVHFYDKNA